MQKRFVVGVSFLIASLASLAEASSQPVTATVIVTKPETHMLQSSKPATKQVYLMPVDLTKKQIKQLQAPEPSALRRDLPPAPLPVKWDVGMNGVPVLDQGKHGSCVTFAVTAALDAMLGKGDYTSQLCSLSLGSYLEERSYLPSGWNGSSGPFVLNQIQQFGIVNKATQRKTGCAGVTEYPAGDYQNTGKPMPLEEYKQKSESLFDQKQFLHWETMLTFFQRFFWDPKQAEGEKLLLEVKKAIVTKFGNEVEVPTRLTFGALLPVMHCSAGACATLNAKHDTWALTDAIKNDPSPMFGGHEMVITGYDDTAVVTDETGKKHTGILILRNSWGADVGDKGNYYMTYEFFKRYVIEVQKLYLLSVSDNNNN